LRTLVESLSNNGNPVPAYQLDDLARQLDSLRARAEGRPDPNAQAPGAAPSAYAQEAERLQQQQAPYGMQQPYPPQQQPPVVVQQGGGGMGGLLTGVLLGEALSHGRDRVIERDVYIDDETRRRAAERGDAGNVDFGQGSNDWNDDSSGGSDGGVDFGSNDSGGWSDN
jgi:hypothetical protein